jgi:hypothetical protein
VPIHDLREVLIGVPDHGRDVGSHAGARRDGKSGSRLECLDRQAGRGVWLDPEPLQALPVTELLGLLRVEAGGLVRNRRYRSPATYSRHAT